MFAFKLKLFEFLLHPRVSAGHSHVTQSAQKGSLPSPCHPWCLTLTLCMVLAEPCSSGGTPTSTLSCTSVPALTGVGKWPESQSMSRLCVQIGDGNQSCPKKHLHRATVDLVAGPSFSLEPTQNLSFSLISQFSNQCPISEKMTLNCAWHSLVTPCELPCLL